MGRPGKGDENNIQSPDPSAAVIEACHTERSRLQIAFINELQQLQSQPLPNGVKTHPVRQSRFRDGKYFGLLVSFGPAKAPSLAFTQLIRKDGTPSHPQEVSGCFSQASMRLFQQSGPNIVTGPSAEFHSDVVLGRVGLLAGPGAAKSALLAGTRPAPSLGPCCPP